MNERLEILDTDLGDDYLDDWGWDPDLDIEEYEPPEEPHYVPGPGEINCHSCGDWFLPDKPGDWACSSTCYADILGIDNGG